MEDVDRMGKSSWDKMWAAKDALPKAIKPTSPGLRNYVNRHFHRYFVNAFARYNTTGRSLLEIGCARSAWLPYFAKEFGFVVTGLDYSELGCEQAEQILAREGVPGRVVHADLFSPPHDLLAGFDVVVTFGVVEHFPDTLGCVRAIAQYLKPRGLLITNIPNEAGLVGWLQCKADKDFYDAHVPLDRDQLRLAHATAGLSVVSCDYFFFAHFGVVNLDSWKRNRPMVYQLAYHLNLAVSATAWLVEPYVAFLRPNAFTSPYIMCLATRLDQTRNPQDPTEYRASQK